MLHAMTKQHLKLSYSKNLRHHLAIIVAAVAVVVVVVVVSVFVSDIVHGGLTSNPDVCWSHKSFFSNDCWLPSSFISWSQKLLPLTTD